jgi:hypothetical protein
MPRRRHSIRHRKRKNIKNRTKRGGELTPETDFDLERIESGLKYGQNLSAPYLYNTKNIPTIQNTVSTSKKEDREQKRQEQIDEFNKLTKQYEEHLQKEKERKAYLESLNNPITAEEFFSKQACDTETGNGCQIMGGRKTRRHKRKGRKYRKSRKY